MIEISAAMGCRQALAAAAMAFTWAVMPMLLGAGPARAAEASDLFGAWRLVSVETTRPNGAIIYPFYGRHPQGLIVYDPSGWMSVQIVSDPKPAVPTGNSRETFRKAPVAQKAIAADGYYAYFGRYTLDTAAATVTHHLKDSLEPGERGEDFLRHYSIDHGRLTLLAEVHEMGEVHQRRLVWQRATKEASADPAGPAGAKLAVAAQPGSASVMSPDDPIVVAGQYYRVVLENDQVRVLSFHAGPGARWGLHAHPNSVVVSLDDYRVRNAIPGREPTERDAKRGDVLWIPARSHTGENMGASDMDCVLVELKGP